MEPAPIQHARRIDRNQALLREFGQRQGGLVRRVGFQTRRASDHSCAACGYQISIPKRHPGCPMCGGTRWVLIASDRQAVLEAW